MKTALQIDPPARLNPATDTSLMLGFEAQKRGHELYCYQPSDLVWKQGELSARMRRLTLHDIATGGFALGEPELLPTAEMGVIWMRQDPPFNMEYITATHLLEHARTRVVNDPAGVRNAPEKLSAMHFAHLMPPTLVASDEASISAFAREHGTVVAKPLHGYGGRSIFKFSAEEGNLATFHEFWREHYAEPLMWQAFLPEVANADRRILLIDGEITASFGRTPALGSIRANMRVGGEAVKAELTPRQRAIAEELGAFCQREGLLICGLDVIGDYLTELNVTSPTGFRAAEKLYGIDCARACWDAVEASL